MLIDLILTSSCHASCDMKILFFFCSIIETFLQIDPQSNLFLQINLFYEDSRGGSSPRETRSQVPKLLRYTAGPQAQSVSSPANDPRLSRNSPSRLRAQPARSAPSRPAPSDPSGPRSSVSLFARKRLGILLCRGRRPSLRCVVPDLGKEIRHRDSSRKGELSSRSLSCNLVWKQSFRVTLASQPRALVGVGGQGFARIA